MPTYLEPQREIPVTYERDVVVVGGGTAGFMTALAAARNGASVLLVEQYGFLGGVATAGLMTSINGFRNQRPPNRLQTVKGFAAEFMLEMHRLGGTSLRHAYYSEPFDMDNGEIPYAVGFEPEVFKYVAVKLCRDAGVELLLHTYTAGAISESGAVRGVIVENKSGRQAVYGKVIVDASGDGDVAAWAGVPFELDKPGERLLAMSQMFRLANIHPELLGEHVPGMVLKNTIVMWGGHAARNGVDAKDLTEAELEARDATWRMLSELKQRPAFEDSFLIETAMHVGVRETRRIKGEEIVTEANMLSGKRLENVVAIGSNPVPGYYGYRRFLEHEGYDIPYGALVPLKVESLLVAGRCISAEHAAFESARAMATCMAIGQAAGTAAALCARNGVAPRALDVRTLQRTLVGQGAELRM